MQKIYGTIYWNPKEPKVIGKDILLYNVLQVRDHFLPLRKILMISMTIMMKNQMVVLNERAKLKN